MPIMDEEQIKYLLAGCDEATTKRVINDSDIDWIHQIDMKTRKKIKNPVYYQRLYKGGKKARKLSKRLTR